jgi:DNA polymerase III alpha subunit (gram-positive type)
MAEMVKYVVHIDGAEHKLRTLCEESMRTKVQENVPMLELVKTRLEKELKHVVHCGFEPIYLHYYELIHKNNLRPSQYYVRGTAASSIICFLLDITKENPLDATMPLYSEFFAGIEGDKEPDINLEVDISVYDQVIQSIDTLSGVQKGVQKQDTVLIIPKQSTKFEEWEIENNIFLEYHISANLECSFIARLEEETGYYLTNKDILVDLHRAKPDIRTREELFEKLLEYGVERKQALYVSEAVRKGAVARGFCKAEEIMRAFNVSEALINECRRTKYLKSRADVLEETRCKIGLQYFKTNYPNEYREVLMKLF